MNSNTKKFFAKSLLCASMGVLGTVQAAENIELSNTSISGNGVTAMKQAEVGKAIQGHLKLSNDYSFNVKSSNVDMKGGVHTRYQQFYKNVPVWGQQAITHPSKDNSIRLSGHIQAKIEEDLKSGVNPSKSAVEILNDIKTKSASKFGKLTDFNNEKVELVVYIDKRFDKAYLAYHIDFLATKSNGEPIRPMFIVDANSGRVLTLWDSMMHIDAVGPGGNAKTGRYEYGTDFPALVAADAGNGNCVFENENVRAVDMAHSTDPSINTPFEFVCPENTYKEINEAFSPINDAFYFGNVTFDMYADWYETAPLPFQLSMKVHFGNNFENATWNGQAMSFGDGLNTFYPLVDINVSAHEVSHGFTEFNSDLIYSSESGGMNESFSDIAGEAAEYFWKGEVDWFVGADIFKNGDGLRYFENPYLDGVSVGHYDDYFEGMGVHNSSGIFNRAYFLLSNSEGWDPRKAFDVFVLANQSYWTPDSTFASGACGLISAAFDLEYNWIDVYASLEAVGVTCSGSFIDEDADGMSDIAELIIGFDPADPTDALADFDADGIINRIEMNAGSDAKDRDSDNDSLSDGDEYLLHGTSLTSADSDDDGMYDAWEIAVGFNPLNAGDADLDADEDGFTNLQEFDGGTDPLDAESFTIPPLNFDSIFTIENGLAIPGTSQHPAVTANFVPTTTYASGGSYSLGSEDIDDSEIAAFVWTINTDDGFLTFDLKTSTETNWDYFRVYVDGFVVYSLSGENDWQTVNLPITAGEHEIFFAYEKDFIISSGEDAAWIDNIHYSGLSFDQDGDTMLDDWEEFYGLDPLDASDAALDGDEDGLTNAEEFAYRTNPSSADPDLDGLSDYEEVMTTLTDPNNSDSDGDYISDGLEVNLSLDPLDAADGLTDLDNDGIINSVEAKYGTSLDDASSLPVLLEIYSEALNSTLSSDWQSSDYETWVVEANASGNVVLTAEPISNSKHARIDYLNVFETGTLSFTAEFDTEVDNDVLEVMVDGDVVMSLSGQGSDEYTIELERGEHLISFVYSKNSGLTTKVDRVSISNLSYFAPGADSDGDGLTNAEELELGTDPLNSDSDIDGVSDGQEVALGTDPKVQDTDGDGVKDGNEIANGTNPTAADTDGDGILDGVDLFPQDSTRWNESGGGGSLFFILSPLAMLLFVRRKFRIMK